MGWETIHHTTHTISYLDKNSQVDELTNIQNELMKKVTEMKKSEIDRYSIYNIYNMIFNLIATSEQVKYTEDIKDKYKDYDIILEDRNKEIVILKSDVE